MLKNLNILGWIGFQSSLLEIWKIGCKHNVCLFGATPKLNIEHPILEHIREDVLSCKQGKEITHLSFSHKLPALRGSKVHSKIWLQMQVGRMHNLQKSGHNSREIPTGELYELCLVNSGSFTKQKNPPQNEIYRPYCGGKLQPRRLASVLHVHFSECFTKHLIPYWSVSFTQKEIKPGPLLPSLLAYCKNFLLYAAWDMEALDGMDSLNELQACASCRFTNRAQWLEASAGLVFVWFDWNFAYLSWV